MPYDRILRRPYIHASRSRAVTAAVTVSVTPRDTLLVLSGDTAIATISGGRDGQVIFLLWSEAGSLESGTGNLVLAGGLDWSPGANATASLIWYDGSWYELARSEN